MKPREELKDLVWQTVTSDVLSLKDKAERIVQHTDQLAMGRWVSVDERLPDESGDYITNNGTGYFDVVSRCFAHYEDTHWIELDMPNGGAE